MIRLPFIVLLALAVGLGLFFRLGRPIWHPLKTVLAGGRTTEQVVSSLEERMRREFPDVGELVDGKLIAILAFKKERALELWKEKAGGWTLVKRYPFTAYSGKLGPKLREGDLQIPEGIYGIEYLNPNSRYYLSLKIDYPNAFDRARAKEEGRTNLGGDIFIHGKSVTIGCIPLGDHGVEEVYYLVARNGLKKTKVIISPYDMRGEAEEIEIDYPGIDWEEQLYERIGKALAPFEGARK